MHRPIPQLAQLLVVEPVEEAESSVRYPRSGRRLRAIRRAETMHEGFGVPPRSLPIPPEQRSDPAPQANQPGDDGRGRLDSRDEYGPHVLDRATRAATAEPDRPHVLQRDVVEQGVRAKGARAKFTGVDSEPGPLVPARHPRKSPSARTSASGCSYGSMWPAFSTVTTRALGIIVFQRSA